MTAPAPDAPAISPARKWAITFTIMVVAFMQILDTSVTNVVLPHLQGSLSAGLDEVSWVITSYLAANAVVIPATGWLAGLFGRKRFFLICTVDVRGELVPLRRRARPDHADRRAHLPGAGRRARSSRSRRPSSGRSSPSTSAGSPWRYGASASSWARSWVRPSAATWPTSGRGAGSSTSTCPWESSASSWGAAFLFDPPYLKRAGRIDWWGLALMVAGFGCLQLVLDRGEREDWFDSTMIVAMTARGRPAPWPAF